MLSEEHLKGWNAIKNGETKTDEDQYVIGFDDENCDFVRAEEQELFSLFQLHLYQTSLGEWNQGLPAGILRWLVEVTRTARAKHSFADSPAMRFAILIMLRAIPWLREHQGPAITPDH